MYRPLSKSLSAITCLFACVATLFLLNPTILLAQNDKVRVYVFAGQSNCNGAGGRIGRYKAVAQDWKSPYVYKMIQNVQSPANDPVSDSNWQKHSYYVPQDLDGDGDLDYEVGTRLSHLRYPFHTIYHADNFERLQHNYAGEYDKAVHPPADPNCPPYPDAFNDNHGANNGFDSFIGAEAHFARKMRSQFPDEDIAIVKVSAGSSSMANWEPTKRLWESYPPGSNERYQARVVLSRDGLTTYPNTQITNTSVYLLFYQHLVPAVRYSIQSLEDEYGVGNVELAGFVWIQGESDLRHYDPALRAPAYITQRGIDYQDTFDRMVHVLRVEHNMDMPFVICLTKGYLDTDWATGSASQRVVNLQAIQKKIADDDDLGEWAYTDNLTIVSEFDEPSNPDQVHWDSESLRVLGARIFNRFMDIENAGQ